MNNISNKNFKTKLLFAELSESNGQQKIELFRNIIEALIENEDVMSILDSSHFFVKEYLQQEFKQSSRFKIDKIHPRDRKSVV